VGLATAERILPSGFCSDPFFLPFFLKRGDELPLEVVQAPLAGLPRETEKN
jgi:hypothetical protein